MYEELKSKGYTLCSYIESDGTQYIDTGFKSTKATKVCIDIDFLNTNGTYNCVFGASQNGSTNQFVVYRTSDTTMTGQWNMSATWNITVDSVYGRRYCELSYEGFVFGESSTDGVEPVYADYSYPLHICAMNNQGTATLFAKQRVYSCRIYDNGSLVRDYVPVMNNSGVFGLYDKANDTFVGSSTSTGFTGLCLNADGLPLGSNVCEYIESNGGQYIDTGFVPNQDTRILIDFELTKTTDVFQNIFGGRGASSSYVGRFAFTLTKDLVFRSDYGSANVLFDSSITPLGRYIVDKNKNTCTINDVASVNNTSETFQGAYSIYLFGQNTGGVTGELANMRLYSCQIYDNDVLVRNFVPVELNRQYGLYDLENDAFYPSASDSAFTGKWAEGKELKVSPQEFRMRLMPKNSTGLPNGYYLCEYIENTGTSYIDTRFKHNQNTRVVMDVQATEITANAWAFEGRDRTNATGHGVFFYYSTGALWTADCNGSGDRRQFAGVGKLDRLFIDYDRNVCTINGVENVFGTHTFQANYNLTLLAANTAGSVAGNLKAKLYSCKIYDNGTLVRDYIPCVDPEGHFGLYDKVTNGFYKSASSTGFAGKVILPDGYEWLEYVYGNGNAYIDTGFKPNQDTRVVMDAQFVNASNQSVMYCFFGCRGNSKFYEIYKASASNWNMTYLYGSVYNQYFTIDYTKRHLIDYNKNTASIDGTSLTYTATTFQMDYNLFLAADNESGSVKACSPMRIYYCKIFDNGTFVRFYIPCRNPSGVYGLYDMVNGTFHASNGTSEFTDDPSGTYTINLNTEWRKSSVANPDSSLYDGVYESFSNYNIDSDVATCIITITGYTQFTIYIRSYAESSYDYTIAYALDSSSTEKATTKGKQNSGTSIGSYTAVNYTGIDGGTHTIRVSYKKDSSVNSGTDRGYLIIPYQ